MRAKLFLFMLGLAIFSAALMFQVKYKVVELEKRFHQVERRIEEERNLIRTRNADLALLTRPQRLAKHAAALDMKPAQGSRIVDAAQIGRRIDLDLASEMLIITLPSGGEGSLSFKPLTRFQLRALDEAGH